MDIFEILFYLDGEVISFESGTIDREKRSFECQLSTHHANKDLLLKVNHQFDPTILFPFNVRYVTLGLSWLRL